VPISALDVFQFVADRAERFGQAHAVADEYVESLRARIDVATTHRQCRARVKTFTRRIGNEKYRYSRIRLDRRDPQRENKPCRVWSPSSFWISPAACLVT